MKSAVTILITCVAALLVLGLVMLYSATMAQFGPRFLLMQSLWAGLGLIGCVAMAALDYQRWIRPFTWVLFAVAVMGLVLVFVPGIGVEVKGANRWVQIRQQRVQPSELAKLALIIALAAYADRNARHMGTLMRGLVIPGAIMGVILGLVCIEPDRGTTILLAGVGGGMLLVAGTRLWPLVALGALGGVGMAALIWLDPTRLRRIFGWWYLEAHKEGAAYQAWQAMVALGSGGLSGWGLGDGRQKLGYIPEHYTDFILAVIGEELGLAGTLFVVVAFILIVICGISIARRARDNFGMLLATGITLLIGMQAFINIGVVTSALPNKGLPLPFMSYGGSSLVVMLTAVGLLISVARQAREADTPLPWQARRERNPFKPRQPEPEEELALTQPLA